MYRISPAWTLWAEKSLAAGVAGSRRKVPSHRFVRSNGQRKLSHHLFKSDHGRADG